MHEKFEPLAVAAQTAVAVLGNADLTDIELLPIQPNPLCADSVRDLARQWSFRGLRFIGTIGIVDGHTCTALVEPVDHPRLAAISVAFIGYCEALLSASVEQRQKSGDGAEWCERLYRLPDFRPEVSARNATGGVE